MLTQTTYGLTTEAKTAVMDLLKQASDQLSLPSGLPVAGKKRQGMGQASIGYVQDSINAAKTFPDVPSGQVSAQLMQTKLDTCNDLDELLNIVSPLLLNLLNVRRLHGQDLMVGSNSIKDSIVSSAKNRADLKPVAEQLKKRYARAKKEDAEAKKQEAVVTNTNGTV